MKAKGLKPKHARAKLVRLLTEKYKGHEIRLDHDTVYPAELERDIRELDAATKQAEKLLAMLPTLRHKVARHLHALGVDQTTIAKKVGLTQSYVATFLQLDPGEVAKMVAVVGRKPKV